MIEQEEETYNLDVLVGQFPTELKAYTWCAIYKDGTTISETSENCFGDVDQPCVKTLLLLPVKRGIEPQRMDIPEGATPVFFRRHSLELQLIDGQEKPYPTRYCIGWKSEERALYLFVFDDGSTLETDNLQAV
jgi:hypothetical protein